MLFTKYVVLHELELDLPEEMLEMEIALEFELIIYDFGCDAVMYLGNGDPGHPAEGPDLEIELKSDLPWLLGTAHTKKYTSQLQGAIETWIDSNYKTIADDAFEDFVQNHEE